MDRDRVGERQKMERQRWRLRKTEDGETEMGTEREDGETEMERDRGQRETKTETDKDRGRRRRALTGRRVPTPTRSCPPDSPPP